MEYKINTVKKDDYVILELSGKLIPSSNEDISEMIINKIKGLCADGHSRIIVDLAEVEFFASNAIGALINGKFTTDTFGGKFILWRPKEYVASSLKMVKIDAVIPITDNFHEAERYVLSNE